MIRMRRTDMAPPSGWIVTPPLAPAPYRSWQFSEALNVVMRHHPEYIRAEAAAKVETENAMRCFKMGATNFITAMTGPGPILSDEPAPKIPGVKPHIPVTLLAVDTCPKAYLAARAIERCLEQATFDEVKLLTNDMSLLHAVKIDDINSLDAYSHFCIREMHKHVSTSHALVVQWDGYVLNGAAWNPAFLEYDYIGSPWLPSRHVGNGGFSLRSKRLLNTLLAIPGNPHPEDAFICVQHAAKLHAAGIKFASYPMAERFSFEGRSWNGAGREWEGVPVGWKGQFGFHSFLTSLPAALDRPRIFHHSGDMGDAIYGLATMKALGGGCLFISSDNRFPYPRPTRSMPTPEWTSSFASLANEQDYVWAVKWTQATPYSADYDLNGFRQYYLQSDFDKNASLFELQLRHFKASHPTDEPWLRVSQPNPVAPIVINRTDRYHNDYFPWQQLVERHGRDMMFIGNAAEHRQFNAESRSKAVVWVETKNLLELARIIAGAKVFIGNQSTPLAIALGLGKNCITEAWPQNPNCNLHRPSQVHYDHGPLEIPEQWL